MIPFGPSLMRLQFGALQGRNGREQFLQSFEQRWMRQDGIAEESIRQVSNHCDLNRSHNLARTDAKGYEAENLVRLRVDEGFHKTPCFRQSVGAQHHSHGQFAKAIGNSLSFCLGFIKADLGELRIDEKAERNLPSRGDTIASCEVVSENAEIIEGHVRESRAPGTFPYRPNA